MSLGQDAFRIKKVFEAEDPFKSADENDVIQRRAKDIDQYRKNLLSKPKIPVFAIIMDQTDVYVEEIGEFWYDEEWSVYIDEDMNEYEIDDLERKHVEDNYSTMVAARIVSPDLLIHLRDALISMSGRIEQARGEE